MASALNDLEIGKMEAQLSSQNPEVEFRPAEPLEIHLVLTNIFSHLEVEDLKSCRQVCTSWHQLATAVMKYRKVKAKLHERNIDDFLWFKQGKPRSSHKQVSLNHFQMDTVAHEVMFTMPIMPNCFQNTITLELSLIYYTSENRHFAYDLVTILRALPFLKHLAVHLDHLFDFSQSDWYPDSVYLQKQFRRPLQLETLSITEGRKEYLSLVRPAILWWCSKLKVVSLNLKDATLFNYFEASLQHFSQPWYPKNIKTFSLKFPSDDHFRNEFNSIIKFVNFFQLEDISFHSACFSYEWDVLKLLRNLKKPKTIKNLAFEIALPIDDLIGPERIHEIFHVLSGFPSLADLKIGIGMPQVRFHRLGHRGRVCNSVYNQQQKPGIPILSTVKSLTVKQIHAHKRMSGGPPAVLGITQAAVLSMPYLESLHVDAFHCGAVADAIKAAASISHLENLTINGGVLNIPLRDGMLFGHRGLQRALKEPFGNWSVAADGLLVLRNLKSFTLYAPPGARFTRAVYEHGFLRMPKLKKLAVSAQGHVPDMATLNWGEVKFRRFEVMELLWDRLVSIELP